MSKGRGCTIEKYGNKSPLMRFVHQNTGYIIVGIILAVAIPLYLEYDQKADFFERWTCPMMYNYQIGNATAGNFPMHDKMTEEQHIKFHLIYDSEC